MKNIFNIRAIKYIIIPFVLTCLWLLLSFIQIILNDGPLTVITSRYSPSAFNTISHGPILESEKRIFEFTADHNNLGYISINFDTDYKKLDDFIELVITEKESNKKIKEAEYYTKAFKGLNFYPFGFPIVRDSKDKAYAVEISSKRGSPQSHVSIKKSSAVFSASYQFEKDKLLTDRDYLMEYLGNKVINSIRNNQLIFSSFIYILPLVFYLIWLLLDNYLSTKKIFFILLSLAVLLDIFIIDSFYSFYYLTITILWIILLVSSHNVDRTSYKISLAFLILVPLLQLTGRELFMEKTTIWAFLSLASGVLIELGGTFPKGIRQKFNLFLLSNENK